MTEWSSGYVADIGYTYGYYPELNPLRGKLAFLNAGLNPPEAGTACELGFGQGMSANIHAAASMTEWHGTDFNPSQAAFAQEFARSAGSNARLYDEAFAEFANRADLPDFDFIGLHGIWSWISDENRSVIVDFIRRKLKVGGVLYISYNTLPGWAGFAPLRHLMAEHAAVLGSKGRGIVNRVDGALEFANNLMATNPAFLRANPTLQQRLDKLAVQNRHYLAHEYFNRDWHPMHFATMADWLGPAKLQYACSAYYLDQVDAVNLTDEQAAFLAGIPDPMFRESSRDFVVNQQFRRDYWVRGLRRLNPLARAEQLRQLRIMLVVNRPTVSLKINGSRGEAAMSEQVYAPILNILADHKPKSLEQIEQLLKGGTIDFPQILQAVLVLAAQGSVSTVQNDPVIAKAGKVTKRLNDHIKAASRGSGDVVYLASPVTGGGVPVSRFSQLFLLALDSGHKQPQELAQFAWRILQAQGQSLVKDGRQIGTAEGNLAELAGQAENFAVNELPRLRVLQLA